MPLDTLPDDGIIVKNRDAMRDLWLRCVKIRNPEASIAQDTQPWIDASVMADVLVPMGMNARTIGRSIPLSEVSGNRLDQRLVECGLPERFPETGSQGAVTINASSTGAYITAGTECTDTDNGLRFKCTTSGLYQNGANVPIAAIDTGTQTNIDPGKIMIWSQGVPGLFASATVAEQTDGTGLTGGRAAESDDEVRGRISDSLANPASAGNDATYQRLIENSRAHGVSVQKAFTYPAINGAGTIGCGFTMKPATPGGSRRPNPTQMAIVQAYVIGQMPADDTYLPITFSPQSVDVSFDVSWESGAASWIDAVPWPPRYDVGNGAIVVSSASSSSTFVLATDNGVYTGVPSPVAGQSIGFYDGTNETGSFKQKKLLSVTPGAGPWTCVADTSNGASDTTYTPAVGQRACPWSDSLNELVPSIVAYFDKLGPGEQRAVFFDPGLRQKRNPAAPKRWPYGITSRIETDLLALPAVNDIRLIDGLGASTIAGIPGVLSYIIELGYIAAFPLG
jgi:baseplate J-like protein